MTPGNPSLSLTGLVVGFVIGLTGMGGGALLTPALILLLGVSPATAVSSDVVVSLIVKPFGAAVHRKAGTVHWPIVAWLAAGSVPSAFLAASLSRDAEFLTYGIGTALLVAATFLIAKARLARRAGTVEIPPVRPAVTLAIGVVGGTLVGLTSVGSGSLMMVLLLAAYPSLTASRLVGTDLTQAVPLVAAATLGHLLFGQVSIALVVPLVVGAIPGVVAGSRLSSRLPDRIVRPTLAVVLAGTGLKLLNVF